MPFPLEYHKVVNHFLRRLIPASLASLAALLFPLFTVSSSPAQIGGVSPGAIHSVPVAPPTAVRVPPPTVMLVPPPTGAAPVHGAFPHSAFVHPTGIPRPPHSPHDNNGRPAHNNANSVAVYPYLYPVPYAADVSDSNTAGPDDAEYQGGPIAGDPRNYGADADVRPLPVDPAQYVSAKNNLADPPAPDPVSDPPQPPTTLVFKDGHQIQLNNYAIVSQTLYDFTPGHPRKIALSDLDLPATQKQNDDRGVVFELPPSSQTN
jgi:hypothetical protein